LPKISSGSRNGVPEQARPEIEGYVAHQACLDDVSAWILDRVPLAASKISTWSIGKRDNNSDPAFAADSRSSKFVFILPSTTIANPVVGIMSARRILRTGTSSIRWGIFILALQLFRINLTTNSNQTTIDTSQMDTTMTFDALVHAVLAETTGMQIAPQQIAGARAAR
jgi:hypothetical protein